VAVRFHFGRCAMAKISRSQKMLSEIELFLDAGNYEDARVLLTFLDDAPFDREGRLRLFLINVTLNGAAAYQNEIDQLEGLPDLSDFEKELVEKILARARQSVAEKGRRGRFSAERDGPPLERFEDANIEELEHRWPETAGAPQKNEPELSATEETLRFLGLQLREKEELLLSRDSQIRALGSQVTELTAQLAELSRAKDHDSGLTREEVRRPAEQLEAKELELAEIRDRFAADVRDLETQLRETRDLWAAREAEFDTFETKAEELVQATERVRALEIRLDETNDLLAARDAELDAVRARVSALIQARADGLSERQLADRSVAETLHEHTGLVQIIESSIVEMEARKNEQIRLLELELREKQNQLRSSRVEVDELRRQVCLLDQRAAESEAAKTRAETLLGEERAADGSRVEGAEPTATASSAASNTELVPFRPASKPWQKRSWRNFLTRGDAKTFPAAALPVAAASLLVLPLGYYLLGHARTLSHPGAPAGWEVPFEPRHSEEKGGLSLSAGETSANDEGRGESGKAESSIVEATPQKRAPAANRKVNNTGKGGGAASDSGYVTRRAVPLRDWPRYAATAKAEIGPGSRVSVLDSEGSWLRVKAHQSGAVGYVRKEYLVQASSAP
jgi:hypothetical protein